MNFKYMRRSKYLDESFIGKKYNFLTVKSLVGMKENVAIWCVKCDCGKEKTVEARYVINGHTVSCGCYRIKKISQPRTHGMYKTKLHCIWSGMVNRCTKGNKAAHNYGDRGIKVCEEWKDFIMFSDWATANGYEEGKNLSIERIDVNGNYCPENCTWIPRNLQSRNRRMSVRIEYEGKKTCLIDACKKAGLPYKQVYARVKYLGWPLEKALSIPLNATRKWKHSERYCEINRE